MTSKTTQTEAKPAVGGKKAHTWALGTVEQMALGVQRSVVEIDLAHAPHGANAIVALACGDDLGECDARARLIVQAPAMYEALKSIAAEWPYDADDDTCECGEFCDSESEAYAPLKGAKPSCRHTRAHAILAAIEGSK